MRIICRKPNRHRGIVESQSDNFQKFIQRRLCILDFYASRSVMVNGKLVTFERVCLPTHIVGVIQSKIINTVYILVVLKRVGVFLLLAPISILKDFRQLGSRKYRVTTQILHGAFGFLCHHNVLGREVVLLHSKDGLLHISIMDRHKFDLRGDGVNGNHLRGVQFHLISLIVLHNIFGLILVTHGDHIVPIPTEDKLAVVDLIVGLIFGPLHVYMMDHIVLFNPNLNIFREEVGLLHRKGKGHIAVEIVLHYAVSVNRVIDPALIHQLEVGTHRRIDGIHNHHHIIFPHFSTGIARRVIRSKRNVATVLLCIRGGHGKGRHIFPVFFFHIQRLALLGQNGTASIIGLCIRPLQMIQARFLFC